jgi:hypothetical protein
MQPSDDAVLLPTTVEKFDALVDDICMEYDLKDKRHAAAVISVAIRHLPNDQAFTTTTYLYNSIHKSLANHVASYIGDRSKHEVQIEMLCDKIKKDPNDQQAWDELQKAADQGSDIAKKWIEQLNKAESPSH